ncbi:MAG: nucleotidyl transferase AbiEii/AbiGii toxin family protein [Fimbriimonadales bacterium]
MNAFLEVFAALESAQVRYLVVGGVAAALHGVPRMTADIDLAIALDDDNATRVIEVLLDLGFAPRAPVNPLDFANERARESWIRDKSLTVFSLQSASPIPVEVDILATNPFDFETAWEARTVKDVGGVSVNVVDRNRLIEMKERVGRPVDLEDAAALKELSDG